MTEETKTYRTRTEAIEAGCKFAEREGVNLYWEYHEGSGAKGVTFGDTGSYTTDAYVEIRRLSRRYFPVLVTFDTYRQHGSLYRTEDGGQIPAEASAVGRFDKAGFYSYTGK